MTIKELTEKIKDPHMLCDRFYSKNTPIECQQKIIAGLENEFKHIKIITTKDDLEGFEDIDPFRVVIIQEADKILGELKDFNPLKRLKASNAAFILFFNNKSNYYKCPDGWFEFLQDDGHQLYEKTFDCSPESLKNERKTTSPGKRNLPIWGERLKQALIQGKHFFKKRPVKKIIIFLILFGVIWTAVNLLSPFIDTKSIKEILNSTIGSIISAIVIAIFLIIVRHIFRSK